ncbi:MAG: FdhD protein [Alteromonadaceae bacterium]
MLLCEGQISHVDEVKHISKDEDNVILDNPLTVQLRPGIQPDMADLQRQLVTQSSCGICGKTSLKSLELKMLTPP